MAKKYIDADLLRKEIEKRKSLFSKEKGKKDASKTDKLSLGGRIAMLEEILVLINSLQQEQPDTEKLKREWWNKGYYEGRKNAHIPAKELGLPKAWDFQQEQPCEDLEKEINRYIPREQCPVPDFMEAVARHFYELGKQSKEPVSEDLEEEIHSFWNKCSEFQPPFCTLEVKENGFAVIARHFAEWQKQQMLKDAVEGFIFQSADYYPKQLIAGYDGELGMGDKVKIVIVPIKED